MSELINCVLSTLLSHVLVLMSHTSNYLYNSSVESIKIYRNIYRNQKNQGIKIKITLLYSLADRLLQEFAMFSFVDIFIVQYIHNSCKPENLKYNLYL